MIQSIPSRWAERLMQFLPQLPDCGAVMNGATLILHGSTARGVDDACSDLDVWLLPATEQAHKFIEFKLDGKAGHVNIESPVEFEARIRRCDFPLIYELRHGLVMQDDDEWSEHLTALARRPMPAAVRAAWFAHHYIEMRSEHRACDSPVARDDAAALLLALQPTLRHALQAAMILDETPYPYSKWLATAAAQTPTGGKIVPQVETIIDLLGQGALRRGGPQDKLEQTLKQIRQTLIDAARAAGLDAPWLKEWYLHLDVRRQIEQTRWE